MCHNCGAASSQHDEASENLLFHAPESSESGKRRYKVKAGCSKGTKLGSVNADSKFGKSQESIEAEELEKLEVEIKISISGSRHRGSHRRVVVPVNLSYRGLIEEIKKLFNRSGPFDIWYEDDNKDDVDVSTTREVFAMLRMAKANEKPVRIFARKAQ